MKRPEKDTLLLMGCSYGTEDAIAYAKSQGIYTIVTDHVPPEQQPLKKQADAYWMTDIRDLDRLEQQCRETGVTGVFAATSEICLDQTKELCQRLGLPFYASDEGWAASRDKELFKQHCISCGLDVPRRYEMKAAHEVPADIRWPVIVKPVDSCGSAGISVCQTVDQLQKGYALALSNSPSGRVIVEDYIQGVEIQALYLLQDGHARLSTLVQVNYASIDGKKVLGYGNFQSRYRDEYQACTEEKINRLFQEMNCVNGTVLFQIIHAHGKYFFLEMGYRLDAGSSWRLEEKLRGVNSLQYMVNLALGRSMPVKWETGGQLYRCGGLYFLWSRPGKIASIEGLDEIRSMKDTEILQQSFQVGDEVPQEISMRQILFKIAVFGQTEQELRSKVWKINDTICVRNQEGQQMLYHVTEIA